MHLGLAAEDHERRRYRQKIELVPAQPLRPDLDRLTLVHTRHNCHRKCQHIGALGVVGMRVHHQGVVRTVIEHVGPVPSRGNA